MKIKRKKGYFYTLEAALGITLVLVSIAIILNTAQAPASSGTALIKRHGFEALEFLDQNDELRFFAFTDNKIALKNRLRDLLPPGISLDADICATQCRGALPSGKTVVSVDYYVSGYYDTFFTKKIKLWLWGSF